MIKNDIKIDNCMEIFDVLIKCDIVRLGINAPDCPYIMPLSFGVKMENNSLTLWFHHTPKELKLDLLKQNPRVSFQSDYSYNFIEEYNGKVCTASFVSIAGCGNIIIVDDNDSKLRGLKAIAHQYVPNDDDFAFSQIELNEVYVLRLDVTQATKKRSKNIVI